MGTRLGCATSWLRPPSQALTSQAPATGIRFSRLERGEPGRTPVFELLTVLASIFVHSPVRTLAAAIALEKFLARNHFGNSLAICPLAPHQYQRHFSRAMFGAGPARGTKRKAEDDEGVEEDNRDAMPSMLHRAQCDAYKGARDDQ